MMTDEEIAREAVNDLGLVYAEYHVNYERVTRPAITIILAAIQKAKALLEAESAKTKVPRPDGTALVIGMPTFGTHSTAKASGIETIGCGC